MKLSLYEQIGAEQIRAVIEKFYSWAFVDPIIGHFFFRVDQRSLVEKQIIFSSCMLGAQHLTYTGRSLREAHSQLPLTEVHFRRRQRLMEESLNTSSVDPPLAQQWLEREEKLKPMIVNQGGNCQS